MRFILFLLLCPTLLFSQIPDYYSEVDFSLSGDALKQQLANLVSETHTNELVYTPGVWDFIKVSDLNLENNQEVLLLYGHDNNDNVFSTDRTRHIDDSCHTSSCIGLWNREHVYPRSLGSPN